jgi:hypothetical protein
MRMLANDFSAVKASELSETVWLLGQPSPERYLNFVRDQTMDSQHAKRMDLVNAWRDANDYYYDLEQSEAGLADIIDTRPIDSKLQPVIDEIAANQRFQHTFDTLPAKFEMVELDKLIVSQLHVDITHGVWLTAKIWADADGAALLLFACRLTGPRHHSLYGALARTAIVSGQIHRISAFKKQRCSGRSNSTALAQSAPTAGCSDFWSGTARIFSASSNPTAAMYCTIAITGPLFQGGAAAALKRLF